MPEGCKVFKTKDAGKVLRLPPGLAKELNIKKCQSVSLKCGNLSVTAKVLIARSGRASRQRIGLSQKVLQRLSIPPGLVMRIIPAGIGQFRLGPIIGILTFPHVIRKGQLNRYKKYAGEMKENGLLYVFTPSDIHSEGTTITGFRYSSEKKEWEFQGFPYPDAVIDRVYPNNYAAHTKLEAHIGNNRIFNKKTSITKLDFYSVLHKDPFLSHFVPETKLFNDAADLDFFLAKYNEAYLKPVDSMRGRGIIHVAPGEDGLCCSYSELGETKQTRIPWSDYIFEIMGRVSEYRRKYIVQAAINRIKYTDRVFSFRVMTTKDGTGLWSVPAVIAKAAQRGQFLTNISAGADYVLLKDLFEEIGNVLPCDKIEFLEFLTYLCIKASEALDGEFGPLGKLGIDVVMDVCGKPWLIESNGNPGLIFRQGQQEYPDWHQKAYKNPLAYALLLAGFPLRG